MELQIKQILQGEGGDKGGREQDVLPCAHVVLKCIEPCPRLVFQRRAQNLMSPCPCGQKRLPLLQHSHLSCPALYLADAAGWESSPC